MESLYGQYLKEIPFTKGGPEPFECCALMDKSFFGYDNCSVRLGICGKEGPIIEEIDGMHVHDFDQQLFFFSADLDDMLDLGAEIELSLGEDGERHKFVIPTTVAIPKGTPHFPVVIKNLKKEFYYMSVSFSNEFKATPVETTLTHDSSPLAGSRTQTRRLIMPMSFRNKSGYFYGAQYFQDSGGVFSVVDGSRSGLELTVSWESIGNAHTMGPPTPDGRHTPHVHKFDEVLFFLGTDSKNPEYIGCECELCYGKEIEPHTFNTAMATIFPKNLPHGPMTYQMPEKKLIFVVLSCAGAHH